MLASICGLLLIVLQIITLNEPGRAKHSFAEMPSYIMLNAIQGRNSINGHVSDTSHVPVRQVYVELLDDYDHRVGSPTKTDDSGFYTFNGLLAGVYQVKVQAYGSDYIAQTKRVEIDAFSRSQSGPPLQVDFTLKTKRESIPKINTSPHLIFAQDVPEAARQAYAEAVKFLDERKDYDQGTTRLKKAIDIFPNYFMALERLGIEYAKRLQYESAIKVLTKAVGVNSHADQSLYWLGISQYKLRQTSASVETLRRAVSAAPRSVNAHMGLGIALYTDAKYEEAEKHFNQAYKLGGSRIPTVHLYLAQLFGKTKRYNEAAKELDLFLKEEPDARDAEKIKEAIANLRKKAK